MSTTPTRKNVNLDAALDRHIDRTRRLVLQTDLAMTFLAITTLFFGGLLLAVLADHWLIPGGLSGSMRLGIFLLLICLTVFLIYRRIVPLFLYPINPVYAAQILEQRSPSIKNAILNWILLRQERFQRGEQAPNKLTERMLDGVTRAAAHGASAIPPDQAIDTRKVVSWGLLLVLLLLFMIGYTALSPKNPFVSMARIMLPFLRINAPQSVRFLEVQPGNTQVLQGERIEISVEPVGRSTEPVYLFFSTDDKQAIRQAIPMRLPEGKARYEVSFPPGKQGFVSGVDYWIAQGDSRSESYRIEVRPVASLEVASLTYRYPAYTGMPEETVENIGDIKAVEGTEVRVVLRSTVPLKQADLIFDNRSEKSLPMKVFGEDERSAQATFQLQRNGSDPDHSMADDFSTMTHQYSFQAVDQEGFESRRSGVFRMEILPDRPPLVQWSDTDARIKESSQFDIPLNGSMELPIQAEDPDFALRFLRFHVESGDKRIRPVELLKSPAIGPTEHTGPLHAKTAFSPISSRLTEGDTAEIWVEAIDTKLPDPNSSTTLRLTINVVAPKQQQQEPRQEEQEQEQEQQSERQERQEDRKRQKEEEQEKDQNPEPTPDSQNQDDPRKEDQGSDAWNKQDDMEDTNEEQSPSEKTSGEGNQSEKQEDDSSDDSEGGSQEGGQDRNEKQGEGQNDGEQGKEQSARESINPETQDGDAMDRILEQMKKEGKLPKEKDLEKQDPSSEKPKQDPKGENEKEEGQTEHRDQDDSQQPQQENQPQDSRKSEPGQKDEGQSGGTGEDGQGEEAEDQPGSGQGQSGESQDSDSSNSRDGDGTEQTDSDQGGEGTRQPETERQDGQGDPNDAEPGQEGEGDQHTGGDKNRSPGKQDSAETSGGDQQGDSSSRPEHRQGDHRDSDKQDIPVDPSDGSKRQRDKTLDPNLKDRRSQGGDPTEPKQTDKDRPQNTVSTGDEGKGRESNQQGQSDRAQSAQEGERGDRGSDVRQEGGSKSDQPSGQPGSGQSSDQEQGSGGSDSSDHSQQGEPNESGQQAEGNRQGQEGEQESVSQGESQTSEQGGQPGQQPSEQGKSPSPSNSAAPSQSPPSEGQGSQGTSGGGEGQGGGVGGEIDTAREKTNLDYSNRITNLVLEYLEDQLKNKPNPELLKELGWTEEQLRAFHEKWKRMAEQAKKAQPDDKDSEAWKEALKSLNIKTGQERQSRRRSHTDFTDDKKETESERFAPPSRLKERFKRYTEGINK